MADYYPLIAKAVGGLDKSTGEARRALYERARTALVTQLRGVVPSLSESDITRERLALEEAIRKVEAESARKSRFDAPPERKRADRGEVADPFKAVVPRPAPEAVPAAEPDHADMDPAISGTAADLRRPLRSPPADREESSNDGLKGFRNVVADAENLGDAVTQAGRAAREAYSAVPAPSPEFDRLEPRMEPEGLRTRERRPNMRDARREQPAREPARQPNPGRQPQAREAPAREPGPRESAPRDPAPRDRPAARERNSARERPSSRDAAAMREPARREPNSRPQPPDFEPPHEPVRPDDFALRDFPAPPDFAADAAQARDPELDIPSAAARQRPRRRAEPAQPPEDIREGGELRSRGRLYTYLALAVGLALLAGALAWEWQPMIGALRGLTASRTSAPVAQQPAAPGRQKIPDRIGANDSSNAGSQAAAAVAQRVVLYEEDPADPQGKRYVGSAVWHTDVVSRGAGQPADSVVRADIEIPERKMTMKWSLQRNSDKTLPASHTVEVVFTLPADFPHGGVQNVPGVLMKENEQTRGVPLSGLAVKVTDGYFLIGLSAVDSEMQRNIALLKDRPWFDVPIVYTDGRRAILAVEKGTPGERAFGAAFTAWKQ